MEKKHQTSYPQRSRMVDVVLGRDVIETKTKSKRQVKHEQTDEDIKTMNRRGRARAKSHKRYQTKVPVSII